MIALDTTVLVRLLVNDDPVQARRAARLISAGPALVTLTVLLESEWVLRFTYKLDATVIESAFRKVLGVPTVTLVDPAAVARALDDYSKGLDFADALHLASSTRATQFATFDKAFRRTARRIGASPPVEEVP